MKKVLFKGPLLTQSGYGVHARQVARWLLQQPDFDTKFMLLPWGNTSWIIDANSHDGLVGNIMQRSIPESSKEQFDLAFHLQLPNEWTSSHANKNVGITAGIETDVCNPQWISDCNKMNAVIVPSQHSKRSMKTEQLSPNVPVHVIPESFPDAIMNTNKQTLQLSDVDTKFNFLVFGQITGNNAFNDRKNIFLTLKWLFESFKNDPDVGIILKTNAGNNTKIDLSIVKSMLKALQKEAGHTGMPRLYLLHGDISDNEVAGLYTHETVKALVSLTRGEGFGLPILEAAASGLPVIATGWSAHTEFMNLGKWLEVQYVLERVHPSRVDNVIFMQNARWASPIEADFKRKVTKFRSSPGAPKEWALQLQEKIQQQYNHAAVYSQYRQIVEGVMSP